MVVTKQTSDRLYRPRLLEKSVHGSHISFRSSGFRSGQDPVCCCHAAEQVVSRSHFCHVLYSFLRHGRSFPVAWDFCPAPGRFGSHWAIAVPDLPSLKGQQRLQRHLFGVVCGRMRNDDTLLGETALYVRLVGQLPRVGCSFALGIFDSISLPTGLPKLDLAEELSVSSARGKGLSSSTCLSVFQCQRAPNTCIGGSGTRAVDTQHVGFFINTDPQDLECRKQFRGLSEASPWKHSRQRVTLCDLRIDIYQFSGSIFRSALAPDLYWRAPNTCIAGSGTRAVSKSEDHLVGSGGFGSTFICQVCPGTDGISEDGFHSELLGVFHWLLGPFFRSLALAVLLMLVAMMTRPFRAGYSPLGFVLGGHIYGWNLQPMLACSVATPSSPVLDWRPHAKQSRIQRKGHGSTPGISGRILRILALLLGSVPEQVCHHPVFLATWVFAPESAHAMGRPPHTDDPPPEAYSQRRPHLVPPDELTTYVGDCAYAPLGVFHECESNDFRDLLINLEDPPWGGTHHAEETGSEWLGVFLHTPHYQTQAFAVKPAERNLCAVTRIIHAHSPEQASRIFDTIVPLRPQRFAGFASLTPLFELHTVYRPRRPSSRRVRPHLRRRALLLCGAST